MFINLFCIDIDNLDYIKYNSFMMFFYIVFLNIFMSNIDKE